MKAESHCWFGLNIQVPGGKITPMKILPNISAYVSLKDFTPDLIFLHNFVTLCAVSHCWFGLNVQVPGVKLPK